MTWGMALLAIALWIATVLVVRYLGYAAGAQAAVRELQRQAAEAAESGTWEALAPEHALYMLEAIQLQAQGKLSGNFMLKPLPLLLPWAGVIVPGRVLLEARTIVAITLQEPRTGMRILLPMQKKGP